MSTPILHTKLYTPRSRPDLIQRIGLIDKLNEGRHCKLTLISAPAGFGKTTLVSSWLQQNNAPIAWFSLDKADNDLSRFLTYIVAALQQIDPKVGGTVQAVLQSPQSLQAPQSPALEALMTTLINEISACSTHFSLVLDDYHVIDDQPVRDALIFLLDNLPPQMHIILISRSDPLLPLSRLRVRGEMREIRAEDLRFSNTETAEFLNGRMALDLSLAEIETLTARTEGWVASLQLAALSLQDRQDKSAFVETFSGIHHYVVDYLVDEVMARLPEKSQQFLRWTSPLERFCADLCNAVLETSNSQQVLEQLEQANLFLIPLDEQRHWYRYHHLFADFLRMRLHSEGTPAESQLLYRRAAIWCDAQNQAEEAIHYALQSGDEVLITDLMQKYIQIAMGRSELHKILRWLADMKRADIPLAPYFKTRHAWALLFSGQTEKLATLLVELEAKIGASESTAGEIAGNVAALRGWLALFRGDSNQTVALASQALADLPADDLYVRGACYLCLGYTYMAQGNLAEAIEEFHHALDASEQESNLIVSAFVRTYLSQARAQQGDLYAAAQGFRHVIAQATEHHQLYSPATAVAYIGLCDLLRQWHRLDESAELIDRAIELLQQSHNRSVLNQAFSAQARTALARGEVQAALDALQAGDDIAQSIGQVNTLAVNNTLRAWIDLHHGDAKAAYRWAANQTLPTEQTTSIEMYRTALVQGVIWSMESPERARDALTLLSRIQGIAQANGFVHVALQAMLSQAVACQTLSDKEGAMGHLDDALAQAEPQGYIYQFISVGPPMRKLLQQALLRGLYPDYVRKLLAAFPPDKNCQRFASEPARPDQPLIEPLSNRELELLGLVANGQSNQEIADELFLAVGTVKKHLSNIFGKLHVTSRTQAAARARELDLLS